MQNNGISKIIYMETPDIALAIYSLLQHSQPATTSVERSFSMLRKLYISILAPGDCRVGFFKSELIESFFEGSCVFVN